MRLIGGCINLFFILDYRRNKKPFERMEFYERLKT